MFFLFLTIFQALGEKKEFTGLISRVAKLEGKKRDGEEGFPPTGVAFLYRAVFFR